MLEINLDPVSETSSTQLYRCMATNTLTFASTTYESNSFSVSLTCPNDVEAWEPDSLIDNS
jgi:hypothetical protein